MRSSPTVYEGRIRPSLIAALPQKLQSSRFKMLRGANSPLPHCGGETTRAAQQAALLRGANSPLPHCGCWTGRQDGLPLSSTRGEFAPPSLRLFRRFYGFIRRIATRGEFAPPSLRLDDDGQKHAYPVTYEGRIRPSLIAARLSSRTLPAAATTRGEFAPPSLRLTARPERPPVTPCYEGRIRPSLIAALCPPLR